MQTDAFQPLVNLHQHLRCGPLRFSVEQSRSPLSARYLQAYVVLNKHVSDYTSGICYIGSGTMPVSGLIEMLELLECNTMVCLLISCALLWCHSMAFYPS